MRVNTSLARYFVLGTVAQFMRGTVERFEKDIAARFVSGIDRG